MSGRFTDEQRATFAALLDVLLPAAHGLPSGNEVGIAGSGLDNVVRLRPDLAPDLFRAIRLYGEAGLTLLQGDAEAWHAARLATFSAYFLAPQVARKLDYSGQTARPVEETEMSQSSLDELVRPVVQRGSIWRAPGGTAR